MLAMALAVFFFGAGAAVALYWLHPASLWRDSGSAMVLPEKRPAPRTVSENPITDYTETFAATKHDVPRVVLITIDSLRWDAPGCYAPNGNTPRIDAFAAEAVLFENAFAPSPWTLPSLASLNTGVAPGVHGAVHAQARVPEKLDSLAEKMAAGGYLTGAFLANRFLEEDRGFTRGFHRYHKARMDASDSTERVTNHALAWIEANADKDLFLWLHYFDPHQPYTPPDEFAPNQPTAERFRQSFPSIFWVRAGNIRFNADEMVALRALYEAEVRYVDDRVGRIFDLLRAHNLYEDALIVVTSDHGEEFWEHGGFEHGHTLYNELLKIPLLVRLPGGSMGGSRVPARVSLTALYPTILELCGIPHDPSMLSAVSFAPCFGGGEIPAGDAVFKAAFPMLYEPKQAVYFEDFKYICNLSSGRAELYNLEADHAEGVNMAPHSPDMVARGHGLLESITEEENALRAHLGVEEGETIELDPEAREELRDLGYL